MSTDRRKWLVGLGAACTGALLVHTLGRSGPARTGWPTQKAIKLVVPFAAGGPTDLVARMIARAIADDTGARVYVESRPGAGGNIAFTQVVQAAPDGYTLLLGSNAMTLNPWIYDSVGYDPVADFEPIAELLAAPNVFFASPASGLGSIADLVTAARRHPEQINYASPGVGTPPHLAAELLKARARIEVAHVVFGGSSPASQAVMAGNVQAGCVALPGAHSHIQAGKLVALALTGETRWEDLPDVPTMREAGYEDFILDTSYALMAPAGLAPRITASLAAAVIGALRQPASDSRLRHSGFQVLARGPTELKARIAREAGMWQGIVAEARVRSKG